jgi:hypothetical protein
MRSVSQGIVEALEAEDVELVEQLWNGNVNTIPSEPPCLVHFNSLLPPEEALQLNQLCFDRGHFLFCHNRVYTPDKPHGSTDDPTEAVKTWLDGHR